MGRALYLFAIRGYPTGPRAFDNAVDNQLTVARTWWSDPALGERALTPVQPPGPLRTRRDMETAVHDTGLRELAADDVAVVYITGHGRRGASGRHYLLLPDTPPGAHLAQGYPTADLITAVLASHARHVLVIVNSCFAGELDAELAALRKDLPADRRLTSFGVISTADFDEMPRAGEFADVLAETHRYLCRQAGYADPHLSIDQFVQELVDARDRLAADTGLNLLRCRPVWRESPSRATSLCLPNPGYRPPAATPVADARRQVATTVDELDYWLDRASGRTTPTDPGWYFTGRQPLTTEVAQFLRSGSGMLVITGVAGTGKSALIARAVTLSDPTFRRRYADAVATAPLDTLPPEGSVDLAALARNKATEQLLHHLIIAAGATPPSTTNPADLRAQLLSVLPTHRPVTIVIDGLDEATEPITVITDLIGPLLHQPTIRLIVGVRSSTPGSTDSTPRPGLLDLLHRFQATTPVRTLRTDHPDTHADIAGYLHALLPTAAHDLTTRIAAAVTPSFLDARFVGERLRTSDRLPTADEPDLRAILAEGTIGLLRDDLADTATPRHPAPVLLAVLRASAFALGAGVPWANIWPAIASAIHDDTVPDTVFDTAITHLLDSRLAGYLTHDTADGRTVYRPVHETLTDTLRDHPDRLLGHQP